MIKGNIVLCDDNADDLETLCRTVDEYIDSRGFCVEKVCFSAPEEVLRYSESRVESGSAVYLFDVIMPETDGIALGKKIRERDKSSAVIYISASEEYALDAYAVHAFSYLVKPFSRERLFEELDGCFDHLGTAPPKLSVKTASGMVALDLSEIVAVEYYSHRLTYHLVNGAVEGVYRKEAFDVQSMELMRTGLFLKVSASYLVNYRNIRGIKADEFIMCNGTHYRITRKYLAARQQYIDGEMSDR